MAGLFNEHSDIERPDLPELLDRVRKFNDDAAHEEITRYYTHCYGPRLLDMVCHILGQTGDEAQDVCVNAFTNFWKHYLRKGKFEPSNEEFGLLRTIAMNIIKSRWRKKKRESEFLQDYNNAEEDSDDCNNRPDVIVIDREKKERIRALISILSDADDRRVLYLRFLKEWTLAKIAREFGLKGPPGAKHRVNRALDKLRCKLGIEKGENSK